MCVSSWEEFSHLDGVVSLFLNSLFRSISSHLLFRYHSS